MLALDIKDIQEPSSLKELFQGLTPNAMGVIQGKVISESPLKIQAVNDDKLILEKNIMCLPGHLSAYKTTVDIPEAGITGAQMTVYGGLKTGDTVYILSFNYGKKYYILDREA